MRLIGGLCVYARLEGGNNKVGKGTPQERKPCNDAIKTQ